jgi:hypothetical protein
VTMTTLTLSERVERWLTRVNDHATLLDDASACKHSAASRLGRAREALEETTAELYVEGAIVGTNKEQRDACLHRLTAAERYEITEASRGTGRSARPWSCWWRSTSASARTASPRSWGGSADAGP